MINLLSNPSKMPCYSFNIPAFKYCPAAQLLAKIKEAGKKFICDSCYACKGFYMFSNVKASLQGKADLITKSLHQDNGQTFIDAMCKQIRAKYFDKHGNKKKLKKTNTDLFRVHDSGDLFSPKYITAWIKICEQFPTIKFWFPTREWKRDSQLPHLQKLASLKNVCIKPSAIYVDEPAPQVDGLDAGTSVYTSKEQAEQDGHFVCPATYVKGEDGKILATCQAHNCNLCFIKGCKKGVAYLAH